MAALTSRVHAKLDSSGTLITPHLKRQMKKGEGFSQCSAYLTLWVKLVKYKLPWNFVV